MNRLQLKIQNEIDLVLHRLKSEPALADKLARLQAELARARLRSAENYTSI